MSTTATDTSTVDLDSQTLRLIATDYAIHRTGSDEETNDAFESAPMHQAGAIDPTTEPHPRVPGIVNPPWWPSSRHRRVPDYAPINYDLNRENRPVGTNAVVAALLTMTFSGCSLLATYAAIWRNTGGMTFDKAFTYPIGGEF